MKIIIKKIVIVSVLLYGCLSAFSIPERVDEYPTGNSGLFETLNKESYMSTVPDFQAENNSFSPFENPVFRVGPGDPNDPNNWQDPNIGLRLPIGDGIFILLLGSVFLIVVYRKLETYRLKRNKQE